MSPDSKVTVLRLDPLTLCDIKNILNARSDIPDASTFIKNAEEKGVDELLTNPLSLDMLAKAVAGGRSWPESRKETFEMACGQMVREHNEEHQAHRSQQSTCTRPAPRRRWEALRRSIDFGCGWVHVARPSKRRISTLDLCDSSSLQMLRYALSTKLFKGASDTDNRFTPVHRHISEFLGARHLAQIIERGSRHGA